MPYTQDNKQPNRVASAFNLVKSEYKFVIKQYEMYNMKAKVDSIAEISINK